MIKKYTDNTLLWSAFQQGDYHAEDQVFHDCFKPLCLYSQRMTRQLESSEDIVAEAFWKAWNRRRDFASLKILKGFLYRVVRNASINYAIATHQHRKAHLQVAYMAGQDRESESAIRHEILRVEQLQEIYEEMENLPDRCGQVFKLIFVHGKSTQEIGALLDINPQTVRSQKARAVQLVRSQLVQ